MAKLASLPPRAACGNQDKASRPSVSLGNGSQDASKGAGKSKYEERWKRPYKVVATVLDKRSEQSSMNDSLTALLNSYPTAAAASFRFVPTDVIAYKTLTLCVDTWQPVLSEWRCGQVQSMDVQGTAVEMSTWTLAITDGSIVFHEAIHSEQQSVQASEINDLRFLSGPSYSSLRNADDEQNASKTTGGTEQVVPQK
uniref:Uncharacterized protein n=1 Tax=Peronospora matthiolae TaxID=2874970 RepID=A0AAV1TDN0_9STRA